MKNADLQLEDIQKADGATSSPSNNARNQQLDGLRGYAAVAVAIFHTILGMDETLIPRIVYGDITKFTDAYSWFAKIVLKLVSGETAVFIFFVLSGAVLFQSLMNSRRAFFEEFVIFSVRRIFRIYPALIFSLAVMAVCLVALGRPITVYDFVVNSALFAFPINGVTWTLNVEMVAIGFILATYVGWRGSREWGLIVVAIGISIALRSSLFQSVAVIFKENWAFFAMGMLIPTRIGRRISEAMPIVAWPVVLLLGIAFKGSLQPVAIALLVAMLYYQRAGMLGRILEKPSSQFLGRISFSFYLLNPLILTILSTYSAQWSFALSKPVEVGLLASIPVIAITIPIAYLSARFIEEPGKTWGRALTT